MSLSHISESLQEVVSHVEQPQPKPQAQPQNLHQLAEHFASLEALDHPDLTLKLSELRMTEEGTLAVPTHGSFALTDWSRQQLSLLLGIRWDRWFQTARPEELADEVNRRLSRRDNPVMLRTSGVALAPNGKPGVLKALVTPSFSPISDSRLAVMLMACLSGVETELGVSRLQVTDRTVSYLVSVGRPFGADVSDRVVGDVAGGILIRNSGVGFASLNISLQLVRLVCRNGLTAPIDDPLALRQAHRSFHEQRLLDRLSEGFANLPGRLAEGARRLAEARRRVVLDPMLELTELLRRGHLPKRLLPDLEAAYALEPEPTAFGISQAVTRASQKLSPEERFELDRAAGTYLQHLLSAH